MMKGGVFVRVGGILTGMLLALSAVSVPLAFSQGDCVNASSGEEVSCSATGAVPRSVFNDAGPTGSNAESDTSESGGDSETVDTLILVVGAAMMVLGIGAVIVVRYRRKSVAGGTLNSEMPQADAATIYPHQNPVESTAMESVAPPGPSTPPPVSAPRLDPPEISPAARSVQVPPPPSASPRGWYPDPERPEMQRYWDGAAWSDQWAPGGPVANSQDSRPATQGMSSGAIVALIGSALAVAGVFLPAADSQEVFTISSNSLVQLGDGWVVLGLAVATGLAALVGKSNRDTIFVLGALAIGGFTAFSAANLEVQNGFGQKVDVTPGVGIYVIGVGALLLFIAGLMEAQSGSGSDS